MTAFDTVIKIEPIQQTSFDCVINILNSSGVAQSPTQVAAAYRNFPNPGYVYIYGRVYHQTAPGITTSNQAGWLQTFVPTVSSLPAMIVNNSGVALKVMSCCIVAVPNTNVVASVPAWCHGNGLSFLISMPAYVAGTEWTTNSIRCFVNNNQGNSTVVLPLYVQCSESLIVQLNSFIQVANNVLSTMTSYISS